MAKLTHDKWGLIITLLTLLISPINAQGLHFTRGAGDESFTILEGEFSVTETYLQHLFAQESGQAILKKGARVRRLVASGQSRVEIGNAAEVTYVEAGGNAIVRISDGVISYLIMNDNSQAFVKKMVIKGDVYPISNKILNEGAIIFNGCVVVRIWANNVSFEGGRLKGEWADGKTFSILLIERNRKDDGDDYEIAKSLPKQIRIHKTNDSDFYWQ